MAHPEQLHFVSCLQKHLPQYFTQAKVLEVGSLDICGSVRSFFKDCSYVGIDVAMGKGVDIVCQGQDYDAETGSFDHVISCEAMEHNPMWRETLANMCRLLRPGGLLTMTCASYCRPEHGTTRTSSVDASPLSVSIGWEYYRNLGKSDIKNAFELESSFSYYQLWTNWKTKDLYFIGIRRGEGGIDLQVEETCKEINLWIAKENQGVIYNLASIASSIGGEKGAQLILQPTLSRFFWRAEPLYYKTLGWLSRIIRGR